jgi:hypothetical protein
LHVGETPRKGGVPRHRGVARLGCGAMVGTASDFFNSLVDWLPTTWLQDVAQILIYLGILAVMAVVPMILWLGYAVSTTNRRRS